MGGGLDGAAGPDLAFHEFCGKAPLLERDGSLFSCDHFVYPEFRLGNILERPLVETVFSGRQVRFGLSKTDALPDAAASASTCSPVGASAPVTASCALRRANRA